LAPNIALGLRTPPGGGAACKMVLAEPSWSQTALAPQTGAVCAILRAEAKPGRSEDFAALMSDLAHSVRAEEPGCESYIVTRAMGSPAHFAIHARFADWDAFEAHPDTPHMRRIAQRINALLAAPLAMELFLAV